MRYLLACLALATALTACGADDGSVISLTDTRRYEPATITVAVGETVTWNNDSREAHSVTAEESSLPDGAAYFSSGGYGSEEEARDHLENLMTADETYSVKFDVPGTYEYFCIPHEDQGMRGTIVVE